jgi:hypothetical protein
MKSEHLALPMAFWRAIDHVLEHYYVDERDNYRSSRSREHVYHSLRVMRRGLRTSQRLRDPAAIFAARRQIQEATLPPE